MKSIELMKIVLLIGKLPITLFLHEARLRATPIFPQDGQKKSKQRNCVPVSDAFKVHTHTCSASATKILSITSKMPW